MPQPALEFPAVALMVGRIQKVGERDFEDFGNFEGIQCELKRRMNESNHRGHAKPRTGQVVGQPAHHFNVCPRKTYLLLRLAQGRIERRKVTSFDSPARKADLPRMVVEMIGASRQQNRNPLITRNKRNQHRSWLLHVARRGKLGPVAPRAEV